MHAAVTEAESAILSGCAVLLSSDSNGMRRAMASTFDKSASTRREVRTTEVGELRGGAQVVDRLNERRVDLVMAWEQAYHNRVRRGTADARANILARLNHACDRLAGHAVNLGRRHELDYYGGMKPQASTAHYWTKGGVPILADPYLQIAHHAAAVNAQRALQMEQRRPPASRAKATRFMRLAAAGVVDPAVTAAVWNTLPAPVHSEAIRSMLGRMSCTVSELAASDSCEDGGALRRIMQLGEGNEPCHLCGHGHDSRSHFRYQCSAARDALVQAPLEISSVLAMSGYIMWFEPQRRVGYLTPALAAWTRNWVTTYAGTADANGNATVRDGEHKHLAHCERVSCMASMWSVTDGAHFATARYVQ